MADISKIKILDGTTYDIKDPSKLPLAGGTMTGVLTLKGSMYEDAYNGALNANNSDIYNLNSIYTADAANSASEGIHFYRDTTHVDTLWVGGGKLLFVPNRELGTSTTAANSQKVGRFTANPTSGQVVVTDDTDGGMKSSGYTIAKSVPSDALFTDHTYNFSGTTFYSGNQDNSEHNANNIQYNGLYYYTSNGPSTSIGASTADGALYTQAYSTSWVGQIAQDYRNGNLFTRGKNNGTWQAWRKVAYTGDAPTAHNQSADTITSGYLNIQPENSPILIPFMNNDLAYMITRGGSTIVKYDGTTQSVDISGCFDAGPGYGYAISNSNNYTSIVMELTLHQTFTWTNTIYVDFGSASWRAKDVEIEVMNSNYSGDTWTSKYHNTSNTSGHCYVITSHTPSGASNAGGGFNKIRFTFKSFNNKIFRIAQLGVYNYGSGGLRTTYMSRGIDDAVWRSISPATTDTYNLGSSSLKWKDVYATTFHGALTGNCSGTSANVTGTVAIANGGTGATSRLNALKALTNENVGTNATYFLTITDSWGKGGYSSVANVKTVLGLGSAAYTASTAYLASTTKYAASSSVGGAATSAAKLTNTAKIGDTNKPVYFTANGVPEAISYTIGKSVPSDAVFTDTNTKVTSVGNHYAPSADTSAELSASATGATAAWSIDVVKGVQLQRDAKGHVTGVTVTSGKIPANPNTDAKVKQTATDSTDANYELLFSATADNTTRTEGARKSSYLHYNPKTKILTGGDSTCYYELEANTIGPCFTLTCKDGETNPVIGLFTKNSSGGVVRNIQVSSSDIDCSNTWDGTNTSLKTALSKKLGNTGSQTITNGSVYISTSTITTGVGFFAKNRNNIQCYLYCGDDSMGLYSDNGHGGIIRKFLSTNEVAINGATYSVSNPANFRSAIGAAASSSRLTKKNIEDITEAEAKKILDIDVKSFDYKDTYILEGYPKRDKYYGVIAEDVLKQIPFVVNVPDDYDESKIDETKGLHQSLLTVDYDKFVPYLIKMVQIQQKEINDLKQQINKTTN